MTSVFLGLSLWTAHKARVYLRICTAILYEIGISLEVLATSNKQILMGQIKWISISVAIGLGISFVVPFPFSLPIMMGVFIWLGFYMTKRTMRKVSMSGALLFGGNSSSLNYYCMSCGKKHNEAACPRCGSKMKRVGS